MSAKDKGWNVGLSRLDALRETLSFLAIDSDALAQAAQYWADAKNSGKQMAPDDALDGDAILAAQALSVGGKVVTENDRHLSMFCEVLPPDSFIKEATKALQR